MELKKERKSYFSDMDGASHHTQIINHVAGFLGIEPHLLVAEVRKLEAVMICYFGS
jgi:hypothetical protein